ncbi:MAG: LmbU family transcriptional regulator, partial [Thermoleophilaceae bacterium]
MSSPPSTDSLEQDAAPRAPAERPLSALTPTSWAAGRELAVAEWVEQGRCLGAIGRASAWWIGDWIRYGSSRYGDRYAAASQVTGYDAQSLMNMSYVASRFAPSRRRPGLSFSHHAELAGLAPEDQELWLDRAEAGALSVRA